MHRRSQPTHGTVTWYTRLAADLTSEHPVWNKTGLAVGLAVSRFQPDAPLSRRLEWYRGSSLMLVTLRGPPRRNRLVAYQSFCTASDMVHVVYQRLSVSVCGLKAEWFESLDRSREVADSISKRSANITTLSKLFTLICVPVNEKYSLVPTKKRWCTVAGKETKKRGEK